jgi:site-specific recombinase XerD
MSEHPKGISPSSYVELVEDYRIWLVTERALAPSTIRYYMRAARLLLSDCGGRDLRGLTLADVTEFMVRHSRLFAVGTAKNLASGLRSFLRYLHVEGVTDHQLAQAVPAPSGPHESGLPRWLGSPELAALLAAHDDRSALGRRDHAIVVVLVRLGLRAAEVAGLSLDDIDWRAGEIIVRGKGARTERLPLPVDVGEALVDYLRHERPRTDCRALFLRAKAPLGLSASGVGAVVQRVSARAGLHGVGPHRLRHSAATAMLRAGASLDEVGQVLRQRDVQVTARYAKVDFVALRKLAAPWPGDAA